MRYLSGEKVEFSDEFSLTGTVINIDERTLEMEGDGQNYLLFIDDNTYTAVDSSYSGEGDLPLGGYVSHGRQTVLKATRINSTITVWGDLQGNEIKVTTLHLLKQ